MPDADLQSLLQRIAEARGKGKTLGQLVQVATDFLVTQPPEFAGGKRDELLRQVGLILTKESLIECLFASIETDKAGQRNLKQLHAALWPEPPGPGTPEARMAQLVKTLGARHAQKQEVHRKQRLAKGLSERAGTGKPARAVKIYDLPRAESMPIGHSRFGGLPDLPPSQPWPMYRGKKLTFLAQLDLSTFPEIPDNLLPRRGHLYAFGLFSNEKAHFPPPLAVCYHEAPEDDEIWPYWDVSILEPLPATATAPKKVTRTLSGNGGHYIGSLFGKMQDYYGTPGNTADRRNQEGGDWINLFLLESVGSMQWSDAGSLYLLIRRSALKKLDFSNVLAAVCSS